MKKLAAPKPVSPITTLKETCKGHRSKASCTALSSMVSTMVYITRKTALMVLKVVTLSMAYQALFP